MFEGIRRAPNPLLRARATGSRFAAAALVATAVTTLVSPAAHGGVSESGSTCRSSQVSDRAFANSGLGHGGFTVRVTNRGPDACTLAGYPRVIGVTGGGRSVVAVDTRLGYLGGIDSSSATLPEVVVRPERVASFTVENLDFRANGTSHCPVFRRFSITLPGTARSRILKIPLYDCATLFVHPIVAGPSGFQQ